MCSSFPFTENVIIPSLKLSERQDKQMLRAQSKYEDQKNPVDTIIYY